MIETSAGVHLSEFEPRSGGLVARSTVLHALAAAFMCVSPLVVFVPAAYVNSGLKNGVKGAVGALAGSIAILVALAAASSTPRAFAGHLGEITGLVLALGVPSIVATVMIRRSASFGSVLFTVVMTSVLGLLLTELLLRMTLGVSPHQMMLENFRAQSAATVEVYRKLGTSEQVLRDMMGLSQKFAADYMVLFLDDRFRTGAGMQAVDVLRDERHSAGTFPFELGEREMAGVRLGLSNQFAPPVVPLPDEGRVSAERVRRRKFLGTIVAPQPTGAAERRNAALGRNACAGEYRDRLRLLLENELQNSGKFSHKVFVVRASARTRGERWATADEIVARRAASR